MTSGEVVTIIKEYVWIVALIGLPLTILNAYFSWGGKAISWTFALTRARRLAKLQKRRARLQQRHDSVREYYGWLLAGVLWVLMLFAMALMLDGLTNFPPTWSPEAQGFALSLIKLGHYVLGSVAWLIAIGRLGGYWELQRYDKTMKILDDAIATLEAKQSLRPAPSAGSVRSAP